jgi:hypothetical protein
MQAVNESQNYMNNQIHNTKTSIRRYEMRREEYIAAGKDVAEIDSRLAELYAKLTRAIDSKASSPPAPPAPSTTIVAPIRSTTSPLVHDDDPFGIFSLAKHWTNPVPASYNPFDEF